MCGFLARVAGLLYCAGHGYCFFGVSSYRGRIHDLVRKPDAGNSHVRIELLIRGSIDGRFLQIAAEPRPILCSNIHFAENAGQRAQNQPFRQPSQGAMREGG